MKNIAAFVAVPLILLAGCSATTTTSSAPAASAPASPAAASSSSELPRVLTASGYVDYPQAGADCKEGNAFKKGDAITLVDPQGKTLETGKLADAAPTTGKDGSKRCQSSFGFSILDPSPNGKYTLKLGDKTKELAASEMLSTITWSI